MCIQDLPRDFLLAKTGLRNQSSSSQNGSTNVVILTCKNKIDKGLRAGIERWRDVDQQLGRQQQPNITTHFAEHESAKSSCHQFRYVNTIFQKEVCTVLLELDVSVLDFSLKGKFSIFMVKGIKIGQFLSGGGDHALLHDQLTTI